MEKNCLFFGPFKESSVSFRVKISNTFQLFFKLGMIGSSFKKITKNHSIKHSVIIVLRNTPLKKGAYAKVVKCAMTIGKRLEFDLHESKILCVQLRKYKDHEEPFDLDIVCCSDDPRSWWNLIDTDSQPDTLSTLACHLFSICPNSASCECGFSMFG
nr:2727_t:CDS:2 [Entrophospora candida]